MKSIISIVASWTAVVIITFLLGDHPLSAFTMVMTSFITIIALII